MTHYSKVAVEVSAYEIGRDRIVVIFKNGRVYIYTYETAGADAVEAMKALAHDQERLNDFINRNNPGFIR